jgi:hypothetical protein
MDVDIHDYYHVGLMYRRPERLMKARNLGVAITDGIVSAFTRAKQVHVDIVFIPPIRDMNRPDVVRQAFSTFLGECFGGYTSKDWSCRSEKTHRTHILRVSEQEYDACQKYVTDLCEAKTPYNYADLALCGIPNGIATAFNSDVDPYPLPKRMYCSQAVILMLRHAIQPGRENAALLASMQAANSRACSPQMLYTILAPHCRRIDTDRFATRGQVLDWNQARAQDQRVAQAARELELRAKFSIGDEEEGGGGDEAEGGGGDKAEGGDGDAENGDAKTGLLQDCRM